MKRSVAAQCTSITSSCPVYYFLIKPAQLSEPKTLVSNLWAIPPVLPWLGHACWTGFVCTSRTLFGFIMSPKKRSRVSADILTCMRPPQYETEVWLCEGRNKQEAAEIAPECACEATKWRFIC